MTVEDNELIAQELSRLGEKIRDVEERLAEVEKVNARFDHGSVSRRDLTSLGRGL